MNVKMKRKYNSGRRMDMKWKSKIMVITFVLFMPVHTIAEDINARLVQAADRGKLTEVKKLISKGAKVNYKDRHGSSALQKAAMRGHADIVSYLLLKGGDPNVSWSGYTPLMQAASGFNPLTQDEPERHRYIQTIDVLLRGGAKVNVKSRSGWTALMMAAGEEFKEAVEMLLKYGADPKIRNREGQTALSIAEKKGHKEISGMLKEAAAKK